MILEGDENFMLTINQTLPDDVTRGTPGEATVTIVDDDGKRKNYNAIHSTSTEHDLTAKVKASVSIMIHCFV